MQNYDLSEFSKPKNDADYDLSEFSKPSTKNSPKKNDELHFAPIFEDPITSAKNQVSGMDLIKSGLIGAAKGGQNINESGYKLASAVKQLFGGEPIKSPVGKENLDIHKIFGGREDPGFLENMIESVSQYSPQLASGAMSIPAEIGLGAIYGASQSPDEMIKGGLIGGGLSGATGLINKLLGTEMSPMKKGLARAAAGAIPGYMMGGLKGAATGAGLGFSLPSIAKKLGIGSKEHLGEELVNKIQPQEARERMLAGKRLGTPLTPGEASARPDIIAQEAGIGKVGEAAAERVRLGQERINKQKKAIDKLYATISPSDGIGSFETRKAIRDKIKTMEKEREEAASPFYKKAHEQTVDPDLITALRKEDKNIANAIDAAMSDPKYQKKGELLDVPSNSIKVLDYAKRKLDRQIEANMPSLTSKGDLDAVRILTDSKNRLLDEISSFSPDYKTARSIHEKMSFPIDEVKNSQSGRIAALKNVDLKQVPKKIFDPSETDLKQLTKIRDNVRSQNPQAWDTIVRNEMERLMTSGKNRGITGRSFFDTVLSNDRRFNQFETALEHNPKALGQLRDMKKAWEHLINLETPRTASGFSKTSMDKARSDIQALKDAWNETVGTKNQIEVLNYLYSDKWAADLGKIKAMPKASQKPMMIMLIGKSLAPSYLIDKKKEPKMMTLELNKGYRE